MDELNKLLEKYKEKQSRYELVQNEATERNTIILAKLEELKLMLETVP